MIDTSKYLSGARRFFGRRELKDDPFYSVDPDVVVLDRNVPIFIATDGLIMDKAIMTLAELNKMSLGFNQKDPKGFIRRLANFVRKRSDLQRDDISIFVRV